jgi:hypothetical protein
MPGAGEWDELRVGDLCGEGLAMLDGEHRVGGAVQDQGGGGDLVEPGAGRGVVVEDEVVGHRGSHVPSSVDLLFGELSVARLVEPEAVGPGFRVGERGHHLWARRWELTIVLGRDGGAG